jgi:hypothetical protein
MATLKTLAPVAFNTEINHINLWDKTIAFADSQKSSHTLWFFIILMVHGVFILPLPVVLTYYFNAPVVVLAITMVSFFANIIANMGGAGIRSTLALFAASIFIHIVMTLMIVL